MLVAIDNIVSSGAIKGALVLQFIQVNQCNGAFKKCQKREINNHALHLERVIKYPRASKVGQKLVRVVIKEVQNSNSNSLKGLSST